MVGRSKTMIPPTFVTFIGKLIFVKDRRVLAVPPSGFQLFKHNPCVEFAAIILATSHHIHKKGKCFPNMAIKPHLREEESWATPWCLGNGTFPTLIYDTLPAFFAPVAIRSMCFPIKSPIPFVNP
ncbi:hypothetical protein DID88_005469 [Monilinia fructigena]|uniref:Uncharacterized protein n=1 Tax=Monilinia fructigena TaxID=38457 RepID=A0A395J118_9HELO|nr:hypothetical protein DID88_005469 [Monilinia fructigena]